MIRGQITPVYDAYTFNVFEGLNSGESYRGTGRCTGLDTISCVPRSVKGFADLISKP